MDACKRFATSEDEVASKKFEMSADRTYNPQTSITLCGYKIQHMHTGVNSTHKKSITPLSIIAAMVYEWNKRNVQTMTLFYAYTFVKNYQAFISAYKIIIGQVFVDIVF